MSESPEDVKPFPVYEIFLGIKCIWQAHSMSNIGSGGTNRLLPRRQVLAGGEHTDACTGDIQKHHHATLVAEQFEAEGIPLCSACSVRDARRAGALADTRTRDVSLADLLQCPQCDTHGFLLPARKANPPDGPLPGRAKDSVIDFSYALAVPGTFDETAQINVRRGTSDGAEQMIMRSYCRSGAYALCVRYKCAAIGVDTLTWELLVADEVKRQKRHQCILRALRDQILSPDGAKTAGMLPHLTSVQGAIVIRTQVGRAFMCSPLRIDFTDQLAGIVAGISGANHILPFKDLEEFAARMEYLIKYSVPYIPKKTILPLLGS